MADDRPASTVAELPLDDAADVFRGLGDPVRIAIIAALVGASRAQETPLSFAELRRAVDVADSGRFNYHLKQLRPRFVQSTDDGYVPRYAAMLAYELVQGRTALDESVEREGTTEQPCPLCERTLTVRYEADRLSLHCDSYDEQLMTIPLPPSVARERSLEDLLDIANGVAWQQTRFGRKGYCHACWGTRDVTFSGTDDAAVPEDLDPADLPDTIDVDLSCRRCHHQIEMPLRLMVSDHPAVAGFHYDRGVDVNRLTTIELFDALLVEDIGLTDDGGAWITFGDDDTTLDLEVDATFDVRVVSGAGPTSAR